MFRLHFVVFDIFINFSFLFLSIFNFLVWFGLVLARKKYGSFSAAGVKFGDNNNKNKKNRQERFRT